MLWIDPNTGDELSQKQPGAELILSSEEVQELVSLAFKTAKENNTREIVKYVERLVNKANVHGEPG